MAVSAQYASTIRSAAAQVTAANTSRDGTGTIVTVLTAGSSGTRIDDITIQAAVTTTAGMVRLFVHDGTNFRLYREIQVDANTVSATNPGFNTQLSNLALCIPSGYSLRAATEKAEAINVIITRAGDF